MQHPDVYLAVWITTDLISMISITVFFLVHRYVFPTDVVSVCYLLSDKGGWNWQTCCTVI